MPPWLLPILLLGAGLALAAGALWNRRERMLRVSWPLGEMTGIARRLADGDLSPRFADKGLPEIRALAKALNEMAATLETKFGELKRLEQVRIDFVANVSHELRTPLTAIKGFAETLADGGIGDPETARKHLEILRRHTDRIIAVVDDLLILSQMESAEAPLFLTDVDLASVVDEVTQGLRPKAESKRIRLEVKHGGRPNLKGDRDRLAQVISNLLDNAIKYTPEGGYVEIITGRASGGWLLSVKDTGVGIPPEHLPRIFERFYRADKARSREMGGTGLGLAIVKHIVQAHGGSVSVESAPGKGSTFTMRLPCVEPS